MSLFIGNISKSVSSTELEKMFGEYGSCRINYKGSYAFAEFDHEKDAEEALDNLQSRDMGGRKINIEWSKKSRRFDETKSSRRRRSPSSRGRNDGRCYNCGRKGHYLRDCKSKRRHSHSRSRSRRRRSSSRDRRHGHKSRRRSHSRSSRSKSHSYRKRGRKDSSRSSSSSRSRRRSESSRDRSPYDKKRRERSEEKKERNNHKIVEEKNTSSSNNNKRSSRSSSRRSDRSPDEKKNKKNSQSFSNSKLNQILDKDMITDKYREGDKIDDLMNAIKINDNIEIKEASSNDLINSKEINSSSENVDYSKFKNDDLKSALKKRGISYPKSAKKNELVDLLQKDSENK